MESKREVLLVAWIGLVGLVLTVVGGALADEFALVVDDAPSIVDFFQDATFDAQYVTGVILETAGFLLVMVFLIAFAHAAEGRIEQGKWLRNVIGGAVTAATVLTLLSVALHAAGTYRAANGGFAGDGYVLVVDVAIAAYWVSLPAWALVLAAAGVLIIRRRSFPLWLGWAAFAIAVALMVVSFFDSVEAWDAVTGLAGLWWLTTAVYMLARSDRFTAAPSEGLQTT